MSFSNTQDNNNNSNSELESDSSSPNVVDNKRTQIEIAVTDYHGEAHGNSMVSQIQSQISMANTLASDGSNVTITKYSPSLSAAYAAISNGADVVSMSLGFTSQNISQFEALAAHAKEHDALVVIRDISRSGDVDFDLGEIDGSDHIIELGFITEYIGSRSGMNVSYGSANSTDFLEEGRTSSDMSESNAIAKLAGKIAAAWGVNPELSSQELLAQLSLATNLDHPVVQDMGLTSDYGGQIDLATAVNVVETTLDNTVNPFDLENIIDFSNISFSSYSSGQDRGGEVTADNNGLDLRLTGNTWKKMAFDYDITENTMIQFDFRSTIKGEIQGFALETDNDFKTGSQSLQLYGTDSHESFNNTDVTYDGSGQWQSFLIKASDYFSGDIKYLSFINDHDYGKKNGNSFYRNFRVFEDEATSSENPEVNIISVNANAAAVTDLEINKSSFSSYGGAHQDRVVNEFSVNEEVGSVVLDGNSWKKMAIEYEITENTVLTFDFSSNSEGEIHGIGFDNDSTLSKDSLFNIHGTQDWGIQDYNYNGDGEVQSFSINVGEYIEGNVGYITFASDDDTSSNAHSLFENIKLYEAENIVIEATDGEDIFDFDEGPSLGQSFEISGFNSDEDLIDLSDILSDHNVNSDTINDFVQITSDGEHSTIAVNVHGEESNFVHVTTVLDNVNLSEENLIF